jgi:hypothetical protein
LAEAQKSIEVRGLLLLSALSRYEAMRSTLSTEKSTMESMGQCGGLIWSWGFETFTTEGITANLAIRVIPHNSRNNKLGSASQVDDGIKFLWSRGRPSNGSRISGCYSWYLDSGSTGLRHYCNNG